MSLQFPHQYNRLNREPIDESELFNSIAEFEEYLLNGPAYSGQIVAVRNGTNEPDIYKINEDLGYSVLGSDAPPVSGGLPNIRHMRMTNAVFQVYFDKPVPPGCFLQFLRFRRGTGKQGRNQRRHDWNFYPIQIAAASSPHIPDLPIPNGAEMFSYSDISRLYIPPYVRGDQQRRWEDWAGQQKGTRHNPHGGRLNFGNTGSDRLWCRHRRASKVELKFRVARKHDGWKFGEASVQTLRIWNFVVSIGGAGKSTHDASRWEVI